MLVEQERLLLLFIILLLIRLIPVNKVGCLGKEHTSLYYNTDLFAAPFFFLQAELTEEFHKALTRSLGMRFSRGVFGEKGRLQYSGCSGGQSAWAQQGRIRTRKCPYTYSASALSLVEVNIEKRWVAIGWFLVAGF